MSDPKPVGEQLAWENEHRVRAAIYAVLAALLPLAGTIWSFSLFADRPDVTLLEALRNAAGAGEKADPGLIAPQIAWYDERGLELVLIAAIIGAGAIATGLLLSHLYAMVAYRRPETPRATRLLAIYGAALSAAGGVLLQIVVSARSGDFAGQADKTSDAAEDVLRGGDVLIPAALNEASKLALAFAFVLISLNALRTGLLSRFMGYLGVFVGVLIVFPIGSPFPIVQMFWLLAVAALFLGRLPSGQPPAWKSGQAEPWPSSGGGLFSPRPVTAGDAPQEAGAPPAPPPQSQHTSRRKKRRR